MINTIDYVKEIMSSSMSADAKATALTILTNSNPKANNHSTRLAADCPYFGWQIPDSGVEACGVVFHAQLLAVLLPMAEDSPNGVRCKEVAEAYNKEFNLAAPIDFYSVRGAMKKLVQCGVLKRVHKEEKVEIVDSRGLRREILAQIPYFVVNI
jgi:hypothetical protein